MEGGRSQVSQGLLEVRVDSILGGVRSDRPRAKQWSDMIYILKWLLRLHNIDGETKKRFFFSPSRVIMASLVVKNPPAMQETWVWSLGWKDILEKEMATHFSILPWEIPWTEEPGKLHSLGL